MSTRSYICIENEDKTITGIYCHWDGYLSNNGAILLEHYDKREKVKKLISFGDLSSLRNNVSPDEGTEHNFENPQDNVCVFYGRDRGERDISAKLVNLTDIDNPESWIEFCYIYTLENKWKYFECGKLKKGLKRLTKKAIES